jgi:hypothetical protein
MAGLYYGCVAALPFGQSDHKLAPSFSPPTFRSPRSACHAYRPAARSAESVLRPLVERKRSPDRPSHQETLARSTLPSSGARFKRPIQTVLPRQRSGEGVELSNVIRRPPPLLKFGLQDSAQTALPTVRAAQALSSRVRGAEFGTPSWRGGIPRRTPAGLSYRATGWPPGPVQAGRRCDWTVPMQASARASIRRRRRPRCAVPAAWRINAAIASWATPPGSGDLDSDYIFVTLWGGQVPPAMTYANVTRSSRRLAAAACPRVPSERRPRPRQPNCSGRAGGQPPHGIGSCLASASSAEKGGAARTRRPSGGRLQPRHFHLDTERRGVELSSAIRRAPPVLKFGLQ